MFQLEAPKLERGARLFPLDQASVIMGHWTRGGGHFDALVKIHFGALVSALWTSPLTALRSSSKVFHDAWHVVYFDQRTHAQSHGRKRQITFKNYEKSNFFIMHTRGTQEAYEENQEKSLLVSFLSFSTMHMHVQACVCWSKYTTMARSVQLQL